MSDESFKYSSEELEGAVKVMFQQAKIKGTGADAARLRASKRRKELESANGLLQANPLCLRVGFVGFFVRGFEV